MRLVRQTVFWFIFAVFSINALLGIIDLSGPHLLPIKINMWIVDLRLRSCGDDNILLESFLCQSRSLMSSPARFLSMGFAAAFWASLIWVITEDWWRLPRIAKFKEVFFVAVVSIGLLLISVFGFKYWDSDLHEFSVGDVAGTWEPRYRGSVVSLILKPDGQYIYKVVTKQNGTFENANVWKITVIQNDEFPELPQEFKILEFSSFMTKDEFDSCEAHQTLCEPTSDASGFVGRSALGHMTLGVVSDAGVILFRKVN